MKDYYRALVALGLAIALTGLAFGLTAQAVNGKTIVALAMWSVGLVIALRGRKLARDAA